ncbi:MAG: peptidase M4 [Nitrososphaerota archaeon]
MRNLKNSNLLIIAIALAVALIGAIGFLTVTAVAMGTDVMLMSSRAQAYKYPQQMRGGWWYGGFGCPMHGGWWSPSNNTQRLDINDVKSRLNYYISSLGQGFYVKEIMEFTNNFYAIVIEEDTGIGAFELLVDPYTGAIMPEPGPNMMWNTKYGMHYRMWHMMGSQTITSFTTRVTDDEAMQIAYEYLSSIYPGRIEVEEPTRFYGYYTMDYKLDGRMHGMLSVNEFTGAVWYHSWHGDFIQELEE